MVNCIKKSLAFTLAETLIVMGIIGVVSALTLPNLNSSTGEKEKVAKVKKIYQNLDDALGRAQAVYGPFDEWFLKDLTASAQSSRFGERMTEFMKVSKSCGMPSNKGCFSKKITKCLNGTNFDSSLDSTGAFKIILADGTSVYFSIKDSGNIIIIDIDGPSKGNNQFGIDLFTFTLENDLIQPNRLDNFSEYFSNIFGITKMGQYASGWIIDYDNMDYLKLNSSGKCPNGTTLNEQNPRCK